MAERLCRGIVILNNIQAKIGIGGWIIAGCSGFRLESQESGRHCSKIVEEVPGHFGEVSRKLSVGEEYGWP